MAEERITTLEQARSYAEEIGKCRDYSVIDSMKVAGSLEILAKLQDEENFRKIVDSFVRLSRDIPSEIDTDGKLKENPLSYLEFSCIMADGNMNYYHPYREPTLEQVPIGETQAYFIKLYGEHFCC